MNMSMFYDSFSTCIAITHCFSHAKAPVLNKTRALFMNPGNDLLSHAATHAVPSALEGLTSVFGMVTGVAPPLQPPG